MNGTGPAPQPDYLAQIGNALGPVPAPRGPVAAAPPPAVDFMGQVGNALGAGPSGPVIDNGVIAQGGFTVAPPNGPPPSPAVPPGPVGPVERPPAAPIGPPRPAPEPAPPRPFLQQVGGGGVVNVPAHETEMRGPHLQAAQQDRNAAFEGAVQAVNERSQQTAAGDFALALEQERKANIREDAANYSAAERDEELQQRQADFDQSVKALSQMSMEPNRFWTNSNVLSQIAAFASITLGGFNAVNTGGRNLGQEQVNRLIDNEIRAQEFAFNAAKSATDAKQTAFAMAMQKYNNVDAARAMAKAAALDAAQAQYAQQAALWKGTDSANRAQMAIAALQDEKMQQVAQGIMFTPARAVQVAPQYVDPRTGLRYSEQEAKGLVGKMDEREFEREKIGLNTAGDILKEGAKVDHAAAKDARALGVQLPNGDVITASDAKQASDLREAAASVHETNRLVAEAKKIRAGNSFRIPGSPDRARLESIQKNLITGFAVQHKLGALSGSDMELATGGTAKLFDVGPGPEAALDSLAANAQANLRNQVKTIPGAPGTAKGEMPSSFTPHGKK